MGTYKRIAGIYEILNTINNKRYIGHSKSILKRWEGHLYHLRRGDSLHTHLQSSWNIYGENSFKFSILEILPTNLTKQEYERVETTWIEKYKELFNYCLTNKNMVLNIYNCEAQNYLLHFITRHSKPIIKNVIDQKSLEFNIEEDDFGETIEEKLELPITIYPPSFVDCSWINLLKFACASSHSCTVAVYDAGPMD